MEIYMRTRSNNFQRLVKTFGARTSVRLNLGLKSALLLVLLLVLAGCQVGGSAAGERALNGAALREAWTQSVGAPINHPPLPVGEILIVAAVESPLVGLDIETGKPRWQYDPGVRIWDRAFASDGERVFIGIADGGFIALDASTGKVLWETQLGINAQVPPLVAGGVVYVSTTFAGPGMVGDPTGKAKLFALAAEDGRVLWEFESGNYILQSPFKQGEAIYVAGSFDDPRDIDEGGHMRIYALNAADASVRWVYESDDGFTKQVYATDRVVTYIAYQDFTVGVDAATGKPLWRLDTGNWVPTFMGRGNFVYYGSANTAVHAVDLEKGELAWKYNIPIGTFNYLLGAPVIVADELVFLTQHGEIILLDAATGEFRWQFSTGIVAARTGVSVSNGWIFLGDAEGVVHGYSDE